MTRFTLKLFVDSQDQDLLQKYHAAVIKHNESIDNNFPSGNSGFDLYCPDDVRTLVNETIKEDSMVLVKNKTIMADMMRLAEENKFTSFEKPKGLIL